MAVTRILPGDLQSRRLFNTALFTLMRKKNTMTRRMTGPVPKQAASESKAKGQTSPDMPVVEITDLTKGRGNSVILDMFGSIGGKPIMGERTAQGQGVPIELDSQEISLGQYRKPIDVGGQMSQQRTNIELRGIAVANGIDYMARLEDQTSLVHLAGARGTFSSRDWVVPLATDPDFAEIMVNPVRAPSWGRHYVVSAGNVVRGGAQLASILTTDVPLLDHIDQLRAIIDDLDNPLQPIRLPGDPAADDEPLYLFLAPPMYFSALLRQSTGGVRTFQQNAMERASWAGVHKHPLFAGAVGLWNNILVKKMPRAIRFASGASFQHITEPNAATGAETAGTVATLAAPFQVERGLLLGAQALGVAYGAFGDGTHYEMEDEVTDFGDKLEVCFKGMGGKAKTRFRYPSSTGTDVVATDHGVLVLDAAVRVMT